MGEEGRRASYCKVKIEWNVRNGRKRKVNNEWKWMVSNEEEVGGKSEECEK